MSGHSHAKTIKHQKNITDQKRGAMFSKIARLISVAVKEKGINPETNYKLKIAMETARSFNMPKENIERAIQNASGGGSDGKILEEVSFEAFGPGGIAIIIEGITDNTNRALGIVKQTLNQYGGKLAGEGSVKWLFSRKGDISIDLKTQDPKFQKKEDLEMLAIESGAEDFAWNEDILDIYTKIETLEQTKQTLEKIGIKIESAVPEWIPKEEISATEPEKETSQKLFDALDESEDVQNVYSNLKT